MVLLTFVLKNLDIEHLLKNIGSLSCVVLSQRSALKNSHITQFPLANFARKCKNLLVLELAEVNEVASL